MQERRAIEIITRVAIAVVFLAVWSDGGLAADGKRQNGATNGATGTKKTARDDAKPTQRKGRGRSKKTPSVAVDEVVRGRAVETYPVYGRIIATQQGVIATRSKGAVGQILVKVGDRVSKGDVLVRLVADMLRSERAVKAARVNQFRAKIKTAEVQVRLAQQELKRLQRLRKSAAFSSARYNDKRRDVERFKSVLTEANAEAEEARAELRMADLNLAYAEIRAPFSGVISQRHTELGAYVDVGDKVVTLVNDRALEVEAEVPAARLAGLRPNTVVTVDPENGPSFAASVRTVLPIENALARTRTVRFIPELNNAAVPFASNQSVVIAIPTGAPRDVVSVHKDAIIHRQGQPVVFVYQNGAATLRQVRLGEAFGARFEVLGGVSPGDKVVVRGNERLRAGQKIKLRRKDSSL